MMKPGGQNPASTKPGPDHGSDYGSDHGPENISHLLLFLRGWVTVSHYQK